MASQFLSDTNPIVCVFEPLDAQAGLDSDSFNISAVAAVDIILMFGAITTPPNLTLYSGATVGAKTTAEPFRFKLSSGDYKAASCDLFGAATEDADGVLALTAATYDHRMVLIHLDSSEITAGQPWITLQMGAEADVLLLAGVAIGRGPHYAVPGTITA